MPFATLPPHIPSVLVEPARQALVAGQLTGSKARPMAGLTIAVLVMEQRCVELSPRRASLDEYLPVSTFPGPSNQCRHFVELRLGEGKVRLLLLCCLGRYLRAEAFPSQCAKAIKHSLTSWITRPQFARYFLITLSLSISDAVPLLSPARVTPLVWPRSSASVHRLWKFLANNASSNTSSKHIEMADSYDEHKKRPPPIAVPSWPQPRQTPGPNAFANSQARSDQQQQDASNNASAHARRTTRSVTSPLASPLEQNVSRSASHASKNRASAMTTLSYLMDQARMSPRKSESSSMPSCRGTSHSRYSEASHRSATAAQARLEALDQDTTVTTRAQIESRTERKLFKMTGQIPPTPVTGMCPHLIPD
jgi:hypothetical protein